MLSPADSPDFVVVNYDADPRVPLILGRPFLRTARALIDVHGEEMTLRHDDKSVTFKVGDTKNFSYNAMESVNKVDFIDIACEEYSQEILVSRYHPHPKQANYFPEVRKELKICETKTDETSVDESPKIELKDLPPHLEYAFLEGDNKLPVIIAKNLSVGEKAALIKVLQSHKRAIAWKLSDIKGINPEFCTHKILMEEDYTPAVQHQRRVNPKIHDVIKKEVEKLLDAGLIYPISIVPLILVPHGFADIQQTTMRKFRDQSDVNPAEKKILQNVKHISGKNHFNLKSVRFKLFDFDVFWQGTHDIPQALPR
ncbi:hypothetical protein Tco_0871115 [Tanacetum coccineum]